ncbi:MAG: glycosyltransferase family 39 protein [Cyanobacteria bacterium SZAS-4]|nr:glycosyltransferase family 39 protein [Cyanobacteria bacterium SZAS-4]
MQANIVEKSTGNALPLLAIALVCLTIFLPICLLTPCYYADDGGYTQMLSYFVQNGKVDLMHWSQPTAISLIVIASLIVKIIGFGFAQLDIIGLLFATAAVCGIYVLLKTRLSSVVSFMVALSIFAFNEVTYVTPTFMTDIPFLAFSVWWLVFLDRTLTSETNNRWNYLACFVFLLLSLLTRSTILLALPALFGAAIFCQKERKTLLIQSGVFVACLLLSLAITKFLSINQLSFLDTTALREIIQLHDFARFNLRELAVATLYVVFACSPLLMVVKAADSKLRIVQIGSAVIAGVLAVYFTYKGFFVPFGKLASPVVILCVMVAAFNIPIVVTASLQKEKVLSVILLIYAASQLAVLPIMAHPLVRHAIPAMVSLTIVIAVANMWRNNAFRLLMVLSPLLIFANVINLQQIRLIDFATWQLVQDLNEKGVAKDKVDAGWGWFCYTALVPGSNDPKHYVEKYRDWQSDAKFFVGNPSDQQKPGTVLISLPVHHLANHSEIVVVQR